MPGGFKVPVMKDHPVLGSAPVLPPLPVSFPTLQSPVPVKKPTLSAGSSRQPATLKSAKKKKSSKAAFQQFYNDGAVSDSHSISSHSTTSTIAAAAAVSVAAAAATSPPQNKLRTVVTVTGSALLLAGILFAAYKAWQKVKDLQEEIERVRCAADSSALSAEDIEVIAREQVRQLLDEAVIVEEEEVEVEEEEVEEEVEAEKVPVFTGPAVSTAPMLSDVQVVTVPDAEVALTTEDSSAQAIETVQEL